jgi:hypothetical protein
MFQRRLRIASLTDWLVLVECLRLQRNAIILYRFFCLGFDFATDLVIFSFLAHDLYFVSFNDVLYHGHDHGPIYDFNDRGIHDPFNVHVIVHVFLALFISVTLLVVCAVNKFDRFLS